ncbi:MAG: DeoR/GlpR transcriptional regulator [Clostridia bacterium]|nr:DeoR/GlpR transcriptional regulator [Clostridia bacterium]
MPFYEREEQILKILNEYENIPLITLSEMLFVSLPTLRRDLIKLEKKGLIVKKHGSVSLIKYPADTQIAFSLRAEEQNASKHLMAKRAVALIKDGSTIMLDAATSTYFIVPYLTEFKNIIVITSGAKTALLLAQYEIPNICTGGKMINKSFSYVGNDAIETVMRYNADVVFVSCRGLALDGRVSDNSIEENEVRRAMLRRSRKKVLLCDGQKIGKSYLHNLCEASEFDEIISDTALPKDLNQHR